MNPFVLVESSPLTVLRVDLQPQLGNEARKMFLDEAEDFEKDIEDVFAFDPGYQLQDGECFQIDDFELPAELLTACRQPLSADRLHADRLAGLQIRSVVGYDFSGGKRRVFFQGFDSRRVLVPGSRFAVWETADRSTFRELSKPVLMLEGKVVMVWEDSVLRFKSFALAHRIFDLTNYFMAATDEQVETFASHDKISCENKDKLVKNCSSWHRKKIAILMRGDRLGSQTMTSIKNAAARVGFHLPLKGNKIDLPTEKKDLKALLQFLDEDLYIGAISQTRFISSGKRPAQ